MAIASRASFTEKGWPEAPAQTTQNTYMIHEDRRRNLARESKSNTAGNRLWRERIVYAYMRSLRERI